FEDENAGALTHDEAVALSVKRAAGATGLVIARGERFHRREAADAHRRDRSLGAAANHHLGIAALDDLERIAYSVRRSRAGCGGGRVRSAGAEGDRDVPGGRVDEGRGNEEGRDLAGAAWEQLRVLALDHVEPANA